MEMYTKAGTTKCVTFTREWLPFSSCYMFVGDGRGGSEGGSQRSVSTGPQSRTEPAQGNRLVVQTEELRIRSRAVPRRGECMCVCV